MLERAKQVTRQGQWMRVEYARFADDLVVLVDAHPRQQWLRQAVEKRLREELAKLQVEVNEEKSRKVDLQQGESFGFLGFEFRRLRSRRGRWMPLLLPKGKKRTALLGKLRDIFRGSRSQRVVQGALKLILEPIFEADFQPGSFGYRPKKSAHAAIRRVKEAILQGKTYVIDFDLRAYFDTVRHHIVLEK